MEDSRRAGRKGPARRSTSRVRHKRGYLGGSTQGNDRAPGRGV